LKQNFLDGKSNSMSNTLVPNLTEYKDELDSDLKVKDLIKGFGESEKFFNDD
jgi:hypothetical protein